MPKKTRREKMAAEKRKTAHLPRFTFSEAPVRPSQKESLPTAQTVKSHSPILDDQSYFKQDLTKSILISAIIFLLEVGIYLNAQYGFISVMQLLQF